jgi:hypothetical protein
MITIKIQNDASSDVSIEHDGNLLGCIVDVTLNCENDIGNTIYLATVVHTASVNGKAAAKALRP